MKQKIEAEVKLFILTKYFMTILNDDEDKVVDLLRDIFGNSPFFKAWIPRFHQIASSRESQAALFRYAGIPYRTIQSLLKMSPKTIQRIAWYYELNYEPLDHVEDIIQTMQDIEYRLYERKLRLW